MDEDMDFDSGVPAIQPQQVPQPPMSNGSDGHKMLYVVVASLNHGCH